MPLALLGLALGVTASAADGRGAAGVASPRTASAAAEDADGSLRGPRVVVVRELPALRANRALHEEPVTMPRRLAPAGFRRGTGLREPARANVVDPAARQAPQPRAAPTLSSFSFEGLDNNDNVSVVFFSLTPPDPQLAVGPNHVLEMINVVGRVFDRNGSVVQTFSLASFFGVPAGYRDTDPKIIYDALSDRWFASYVSFIDHASGSDEGLLHLAISQTDDPTGAWNVYDVTFVNVFPDYAGLGLTDDKVTLSANVFDIDGPPGVSPGCSPFSGYCGEQTIVIEKSDVLAGVPAGSVGTFLFPRNSSRFTVRPAHSLSSVSDQYLTTWNAFVADELTVIRITGTPDGGDVTEASATNVTTLVQDDPPPSLTAGVGDCSLQFQGNLGPPPCVDSGDFRMLEAVWRDNSLWSAASAACTPPGDGTVRSCAHLVEVETVGAPSLVQDIMFGAANEYFSWPAIRTDSSGNLYVSLTHTSTSIFAEARVAGRQAGDAPNTMSGSILLRAGDVVHASGRWGDYLGAAVDPANPSCIWLVGQYAKSTFGPNWGTYIAATSFSSADCGGATLTPTATPINTPPPTPTATPAPVGGIAELPAAARSPTAAPDSAAINAGALAWAFGAATLVAAVLRGAAWYTKRRSRLG